MTVPDNPIENQVLCGLNSINKNLTVEVNLKQLLLVYKTMEELISFFHQPDCYPTINDVQKYMGNKESGMYSILSRIYYQEFDKMLPDDVS